MSNVFGVKIHFTHLGLPGVLESQAPQCVVGHIVFIQLCVETQKYFGVFETLESVGVSSLAMCRTHRVHPELCLLLPSRRLARFLGYAAKNSFSSIPSKVP